MFPAHLNVYSPFPYTGQGPGLEKISHKWTGRLPTTLKSRKIYDTGKVICSHVVVSTEQNRANGVLQSGQTMAE